MNNQFAENLGIRKGGLQTLRKEIKKNIKKAIYQLLEGKLKMPVLDKLVERNPIEVPGALIEAEIDHLQQMTRQQIVMQANRQS